MTKRARNPREQDCSLSISGTRYSVKRVQALDQHASEVFGADVE